MNKPVRTLQSPEFSLFEVWSASIARRATLLGHKAKLGRCAFKRRVHCDVVAKFRLSEQAIPEAFVRVSFHARYMTRTEKQSFDLQQL